MPTRPCGSRVFVLRTGADVSVTVRMTVRAAIDAIDEAAWMPIEYTDAVYDEPSGRWISRAEVAEIDFTAFTRLASERTPGRLVVRRIPNLDPRSTPRSRARSFNNQVSVLIHYGDIMMPFRPIDATEHRKWIPPSSAFESSLALRP